MVYGGCGHRVYDDKEACTIELQGSISITHSEHCQNARQEYTLQRSSQLLRARIFPPIFLPC